MYNLKNIVDSFESLVGWRQHDNTDELRILDSLTQSESSSYYQSEHPLVRLPILKSIAPDYSQRVIADWGIYINYRAGDTIKFDNIQYIATANSVGKVPNLSPSYWRETEPFSEYLKTVARDAIQKVVQTFITNKLVSKSTKSILETRPLFDGAGRLSDLEAVGTSLVGFEISSVRSPAATLVIEAIGTQFTGTGNLTFYLFHSSQNEPVKTFTVNRTKSGSVEWTNQRIELPYKSSDFGGSWYLVYDQNELGESQAVVKVKDWSRTPCQGCNPLELRYWKTTTEYAEFYPFRVSASPDELWDVSRNIYTPTTNYGLNLKISVLCDITNVIIENKQMFRDVISKQVACDVLREIAYNPNVRLNRTEAIASKMEILYELDGDSSSNKKSGLVHQLNKALEALDIDTKELDRVCLNCGKNQGIKMKSVWT